MPQKKSTAKKLKKSKSTMHKSTGIFPNEQNKKKGTKKNIKTEKILNKIETYT